MKLRIARKILDRRHRVTGLNYRGNTLVRARAQCRRRREKRWWVTKRRAAQEYSQNTTAED